MSKLRELIEGAETIEEIAGRVRKAGGFVHLDYGGASRTCRCQCPDGPCEHVWNGEPEIGDEGRSWSVTCSRCGMSCMAHDLRVAP